MPLSLVPSMTARQQAKAQVREQVGGLRVDLCASIALSTNLCPLAGRMLSHRSVAGHLNLLGKFSLRGTH